MQSNSHRRQLLEADSENWEGQQVARGHSYSSGIWREDGFASLYKEQTLPTGTNLVCGSPEPTAFPHHGD